MATGSTSATTSVLLDTALSVILVGGYVLFFLVGFAVLVVGSWFTGGVLGKILDLATISSADQPRTPVQKKSDIARGFVLIMSAIGYIIALLANFAKHSKDGDEWPGVLMIAMDCVVGVLMGHGVLILTVLLGSLIVIAARALGMMRNLVREPERKERRGSTGALGDSGLALDRDGRIVVSDNANPEHLPRERVEVPEAEQDDEGDDGDEVEDWASYAEGDWSD
ncbi:hypothetical protein LTS10_006586 [Elasticomyces elasticus]|nr:hypothetical protein LTS10_006586 [Elasticomyces elasticus]